MIQTTVDLNRPSYYAEPAGPFYSFIRQIKYKHIFKLIRKNKTSKDDFKLLEVGTGSGFLLSFLEVKYPKAILNGLEYDDRLVELTKSKLKQANVKQGNAEDFIFENKFDIIVSLQVIEHLYNPNKMINSVKNNLNKNGVFIFTTPNLGCLSKRIMKSKWHGFRDDHVSLKSVNEWDLLLEENGFEKVYSGSTFFTGIPLLNRLPFGIFNWVLLFLFGSFSWKIGESYIGVFRVK
jgi:SAM-dependent methyltransferase